MKKSTLIIFVVAICSMAFINPSAPGDPCMEGITYYSLEEALKEYSNRRRRFGA